METLKKVLPASHFINLRVRINGEWKEYQADWLKDFVKTLKEVHNLREHWYDLWIRYWVFRDLRVKHFIRRALWWTYGDLQRVPDWLWQKVKP